MCRCFKCWFILTWAPSIEGANLLANTNSYTGFSILTESLFISLALNVFSLVLVSKLTEQSLTEKIQAYAYTRSRPKEIKANKPIKDNRQLLVKDLKSLAAAIVGNERMISAFETYAEESGEHKTHSEYSWVIDPLDGTTNFAHGLRKQMFAIAFRIPIIQITEINRASISDRIVESD